VDHISLGMQLVKRNGMRFVTRPDEMARDMQSLLGNPVRYDGYDALPRYTTLLILLLAFSILWSDIRCPLLQGGSDFSERLLFVRCIPCVNSVFKYYFDWVQALFNAFLHVDSG
jgi:hypothetical protein